MILQIVLVVLGLLTYVYYRSWRKMRLWSSMGVEEDPGSFPFGSQPNWGLMTQKISFNETFEEAYPKFKHLKLWGYYGNFGAPHLVVNDMELIKDVMIKVASYRTERNGYIAR